MLKVLLNKIFRVPDKKFDYFFKCHMNRVYIFHRYIFFYDKGIKDYIQILISNKMYKRFKTAGVRELNDI